MNVLMYSISDQFAYALCAFTALNTVADDDDDDGDIGDFHYDDNIDEMLTVI